MSDPFRLVLDHDGIALSREGESAERMRVALDAPDFDAQIGQMRDLMSAALAEEGAAPPADGTLHVTVVLPDSQILYTETPASGLDKIADATRVENALVGATPYQLEELVWDWGLVGKTLRIAVVARDTISEARTFAEGHGFSPGAYVGAAVGAGFPGAPIFERDRSSETADQGTPDGAETESAAESVPAEATSDEPSNGSGAVVPDTAASAQDDQTGAGSADAPQDAAPASATTPTAGVSSGAEPETASAMAPPPLLPPPVAPGTTGDAEPSLDDAAEAAATESEAAPTDAPEAKGEVVAAFTSFRARAARKSAAEQAIPAEKSPLTPLRAERGAERGPATPPKVAPAPLPGATPEAPASKAPLAAPNPAPLSAQPPRAAPSPAAADTSAARANLSTLAKATRSDETGMRAEPEQQPAPRPRKEIRRRLVGKVVPAPVGAAPSATSEMDESESLTVFGARRTGAEGRGGSARLGIVLTIALLAVMGLVALWSLWTDQQAEPEALALVRPDAAVEGAEETAPNSSGSGLSVEDANGTLEIAPPTMTPLPEGGPETAPEGTPLAAPEPTPPLEEAAPTAGETAPLEIPEQTSTAPEPRPGAADVNLTDTATQEAAPSEPEFDAATQAATQAATDTATPPAEPRAEAVPQTPADTAETATDTAVDMAAAPSDTSNEAAPLPEAVAAQTSLSPSGSAATTVPVDAPALVTAALTPPGGAEPAPLRLQDLRLPETTRRDAAPDTPVAPLPRGSFLGPDGLVVPLPDGALAPGGYALFTGTPPILPPARPGEADADTETGTAPENVADPDPLEDFRPQPRPEEQGAVLATDPEEETQEIAETEGSGIRPRGRPDGLSERAAELAAQAEQAEAVARAQAEAAARAFAEAEATAAAAAEAAVEQIAIDTAGATRLAVPTALKPPSRPAYIDRMVARAQRTAQAEASTRQAQSAPSEAPPAPAAVQTAAASAAAAPAPNAPIIRRSDRVRPPEPSSALVARQATQNNALRLNRVTLIGVYGSASQRRALVRLPSGRYVKVQVGDRLDGGRVTAMTRNSLQYTKSGRAVELEMPSG